MLNSLAPARRRLVVGLAALTVVVIAAGGAVALLVRAPAVVPADQALLGPVLLVPGYGGSTSSMAELAASLEDEGRETLIVPSPGTGTGDLRGHARALADIATAAIDDGSPSVDVVGYSAGGVVARYWAAELGGDAQARRVVSLASPQHGTDLADVASQLAPDACPQACRQLAPQSDLLRRLNAGDETPDGPRWVAIWTEDDATVTPPSSGTLEGALSYSVQSVCPGLKVSHGDVPRVEQVQAMTLVALSATALAAPTDDVC